jgi:hypothetical protein
MIHVVIHGCDPIHDRMRWVYDVHCITSKEIQGSRSKRTIAIGHISSAKAPGIVTLNTDTFDNLAALVNIVCQVVADNRLIHIVPQIIVSNDDDAVVQ